MKKMENLKFLVFWDSNPGPSRSLIIIFSFPAKIKILSFFFHLHDENEENGKNPKTNSGIRTRDQADCFPHPNQYDN